MGTIKGNRTGARQRTKRATIQADFASQGSNGSSAHNGAADAGLHIETVRMRAYELFLERGATHGDDLADWFRAEHELRAASSF
jgi:DUF2934 family protein